MIISVLFLYLFRFYNENLTNLFVLLTDFRNYDFDIDDITNLFYIFLIEFLTK